MSLFSKQIDKRIAAYQRDLLADVTGKYHELWHAQAQYYTEKTA